MIPKFLEHEVQCLINRGELSLRKIARVTGVSRGTVANIANSSRKIKERKAKNQPSLAEDPLELLRDSEGPPKRCLTCGARVFGSCHYCAAVAFAAIQEKRPLDRRGPETPLGIEFKTGAPEAIRGGPASSAFSKSVGRRIAEAPASPLIRRRRRENFVGSIEDCFDRIDAGGGIDKTSDVRSADPQAICRPAAAAAIVENVDPGRDLGAA